MEELLLGLLWKALALLAEGAMIYLLRTWSASTPVSGSDGLRLPLAA